MLQLQSTNGQCENSVKTVKKSLIASIKQHKNINTEIVLNRFLFDYRITKHCTTNETPMKLMTGREAKSLFSLMKPPIVSNVIEKKQQNQIRNYKGKRNLQFKVGQSVYVRNYKNPNKPDWSKAIIRKQIGPRNYTCLLLHENRDIKRHLDQIRNAEIERGESDEMQDQSVYGTPTHSDSEHESSDEDSSNIVTTSTNVSVDDATDTSNANVSIPDIVERPDTRSCAVKAKEAITGYFRGSRT